MIVFLGTIEQKFDLVGRMADGSRCSRPLGMCRHYVDRLVQYSTGRNKAAAATAKLAYELKRQRYPWTSALTVCTDSAYYNHLKVLTQVSVATAAMLTNKGKLTKFWGPKVTTSSR